MVGCVLVSATIHPLCVYHKPPFGYGQRFLPILANFMAFNIIDHKRRGTNDDRYARPRVERIVVSQWGKGYCRVFGYDYKINGKYYKYDEKGDLCEVTVKHS